MSFNFYFLNKWPNWVRWVFFLPITILIYIAVDKIVQLVIYKDGFRFDNQIIFYIIDSIENIIFSFIFIYFPVSIVPKGKRIVTVVLTAVICCLISIAVYPDVNYLATREFQLGILLYIISSSIGIITAVVMTCFVFKHFNRANLIKYDEVN